MNCVGIYVVREVVLNHPIPQRTGFNHPLKWHLFCSSYGFAKLLFDVIVMEDICELAKHCPR